LILSLLIPKVKPSISLLKNVPATGKKENSGILLDPDVVEVFLELVGK
jgi:hypothetical protein